MKMILKDTKIFMKEFISNIIYLTDKKMRMNFLFILFAMFFGGILEVIGIGIIPVYLKFLSGGIDFTNYPYIASIFENVLVEPEKVEETTAEGETPPEGAGPARPALQVGRAGLSLPTSRHLPPQVHKSA